MAKYLHYYETDSAFEADYNGVAYVEPWLSFAEESDRVDYNKAANITEITYDFHLDLATIEKLGITCEDLDDTGNTYPITIHYVNAGVPDFTVTGTLEYNGYSWETVDTEYSLHAYCDDGEITFIFPS